MSSYEKLYSDDCKNYTDDESLEENIEFQQQGRRWNSKWLFYSLLVLLTNTASFLTGKYWPSTPLQHLQALTTWCKRKYPNSVGPETDLKFAFSAPSRLLAVQTPSRQPERDDLE